VRAREEEMIVPNKEDEMLRRFRPISRHFTGALWNRINHQDSVCTTAIFSVHYSKRRDFKYD